MKEPYIGLTFGPLTVIVKGNQDGLALSTYNWRNEQFIEKDSLTKILVDTSHWTISYIYRRYSI
ncbi:MAG: hypothetical protein KBD25_01075 [Rickettsiaceae bacterium]|nr:hypothetical protein [Rickettsiaceae bacterium]